MDVADQIRQIYEKLPYPRVEGSSRRTPRWQLAPMDWITTMWQPAKPAPDRILVAGCGTGAEAFALRRKFPDADITAVDFSRHSIDLALAAQRRARPTRKIRFLVGDLTGRDFAKQVGRSFDFITCHGVISYIQDPARALDNLARSLAPDAALYLGVNGATHFSVAWRRVLPNFGYSLNRFEDATHLRQLLSLFDALAGHRAGVISKQDSAFLAGDLFGALNQALPLTQWNRIARRAGLHCRGSFAALAALRPALNEDLYGLLMPRSRVEVAELLDWLCPSAFHWLIYTCAAPPEPPWHDVHKMRDWHPQLTPLYIHRWPKRASASNQLQRVEFRSRSTNALVEMRVPGWELEILRRSNGIRSLRQILASLPAPPPATTLRSQIYVLHQFGILNLLPPMPDCSLGPRGVGFRPAASAFVRSSRTPSPRG